LHKPDQKSITIDFSRPRDIDMIRRLLESADVVIEAARPRALEQLGLGPEQVAPRCGGVWLSVTGYGRHSPADGWVAFGDDGAAAGGLVTWSLDGTPNFVGDAIADPLTGLFGALGVVESLIRGGGHLVDVSLQRSSAWIAANARDPIVNERFD
jgi:crotonobetainyl-CoA:carnitine CoA-transferase CaiB-like acyl-CoA transferase